MPATTAAALVAPARPRRRRTRLAMAAAGGVRRGRHRRRGAGLQGPVGDATLFFYNADEAVAQRDELGDQAVPPPGHGDAASRSSRTTALSRSPSRSTACAVDGRARRATRRSCSSRASRSCSRATGRGRRRVRESTASSSSTTRVRGRGRATRRRDARRGGRRAGADERRPRARPGSCSAWPPSVARRRSRSPSALARRRPHLIVASAARTSLARACGGAVAGVRRHGAGAHHPRLLGAVRRRQRQHAARPRSTTSPRCGPRSRARSCCGR